ncbi:MAG: hypothetical protein ACI4X9_02810 [Kiritimatiellia bacterium]
MRSKTFLLTMLLARLLSAAPEGTLLREDFEGTTLGESGLPLGWGGGNHWAYVSNVKPHGGKHAVVWASGREPGQQASSIELLPANHPDRDRLVQTGYLRLRYWFCPDTPGAGFWSELRTNMGRPLIWGCGPDFYMNAGWKPKDKRQIPDFKATKPAIPGQWHRITIDIPMAQTPYARMEIRYPDGTIATGTSDFDHRPPETRFTWVPIYHQHLANARILLDDITVDWIPQ